MSKSSLAQHPHYQAANEDMTVSRGTFFGLIGEAVRWLNYFVKSTIALLLPRISARALEPAGLNWMAQRIITNEEEKTYDNGGVEPA